MDARIAERIESATDAGAATLLGIAVAYALWSLTEQASTALAALPAFALAIAWLRRIDPRTPMSNAVVSERSATRVTNLLAEADRSIAHAADELVLDDILAALDPNSRVVQLFERGAMPTAGALKSRIDDHLQNRPLPMPAPDASQALHDALAELRRSLN